MCIRDRYKDYYLFDTPYLFLNSDEVYDIGFGGEAGEKIMEGVEDVGPVSYTHLDVYKRKGIRSLGGYILR